MLKNLFILIIMIFIGLIYYIFSLSKNDLYKKEAFFIKIFLLILSFILAFLKQEFIFIGGLTFGGETSVMMLIVIEIVDAFIDKKHIKK